MWFVFLAIGLCLLALCGTYFRRRIVTSAATLGLGPRGQRVLRWLVPYLLFGYPVLAISFVLISVLMGRASLSLTPGPLLLVVLVFPFWLSVLVVLQSVPFFVVVDLASALTRRFSQTDNAELLAARGRKRAIALIAVAALFAVYTPGRIWWERGDLELRRHQLGEGRGTPMKIAFVADLQRDNLTDSARTRQVIETLNALDADIVLSGGDWINSGPDKIEEVANEAGRLHSRLGTFSVRGDHEHFAYRDRDRSTDEITAAMQAAGVAMLNNEIRHFEHEGKDIAVLFLNYNYIYRTPPGEIAALVDKLAGADYRIVVSHQFDDKVAAIVRDKVELVLAAHTHGGQVNPFVGVGHLPLARVETRYIRGRYPLGKSTTVIVTSGVGFSVAPFRYASPASVEFIELRI